MLACRLTMCVVLGGLILAAVGCGAGGGEGLKPPGPTTESAPKSEEVDRLKKQVEELRQQLEANKKQPAGSASGPLTAAAKPQPDGRTPVSDADLKKKPYCYVGRFVNAKYPEAGWATGVLIGPRHVITAAHWIEKMVALEGDLGKVTFILPDGRSRIMGDAELDGGWKKKLVTYDFAIIALEGEELGGDGKHAKWAAFENARDLNTTMHVTGYDADLWAGKPALPTLYDRTALVVPYTGYLAEHVATSGGVTATARYLTKRAGTRGGLFDGVVMLGATYYSLQGQVHDDMGWSAPRSYQYAGASGGPLWYDRDDGKGAWVVGVTGQALSNFHVPGTEPDPYGRSVGSRITPGICVDMINNFIRTHKK